MKILKAAETVFEGLNLPECPRWRNGALYFSDIAGGRVFRLDPDDKVERIFQTDADYIGGLGFAEDGALIAVSSKQRKLLRLSQGGPVDYADLSGLCRFVLNDMVMQDGRCFVSQPGFDIWSGHVDGMPPLTDIIGVHPNGERYIAASEMASPNGMAISADGRSLYVAESTAMRISCFDIDPASGKLSNRRVFADLPDGGIPDGIALDRDGAIWAALPVAVTASSYGAGPGVVRIEEGGRVTHLAPVNQGRRALACALAGEDERTLYICTVPDFDGAAAFSEAAGRLERVHLG